MSETLEMWTVEMFGGEKNYENRKRTAWNERNGGWEN